MSMISQSTSKGHYLVATSGGSAYVRVEGLGTMQNCAPLQDFLEDLRSRGCGQFIFDLSDCRGFDSSFLGTLVGVARQRREDGVNGKPRVIILNASEEQRRLIVSVGVDRLVEICTRLVQFPSVKLRRLDDRAVPVDSHLQSLVRAHQDLIELDERNEEKFGAFVRLARKEMGHS